MGTEQNAQSRDTIVILTNEDGPNTETELAETLLRFVGYEVEVCKELPKEYKDCELIILNVRPMEEAYEIARRLRTSKCSHVPVIIFLESKTYDILMRIYQLGISDYIEVPIVDVELISKVALHIELKKSRERIETLYNELRQNLDLSKQLQRMMLPMPLAFSGGVWLTSHYQPSEIVGGDIYDFVQLGDELLVYLADISGHGIQSALLCSAVKSIVRYAWGRSGSLASMVNEVAEQLRSVLGQNYVTGLFLKLESDGRITYLNCGHPPLLIYDGSSFRQLEMIHSYPIGLVDIEYSSSDEGELRLDEGLTYVLYTDGIYSPFERNRYFDTSGVEGFTQFLNSEIAGIAPQALPFYVPSKLRVRFGDFPDDYTLVAFGATESYAFTDNSKFLAYNVSEFEERLVRELKLNALSENGTILLTKDGTTATLLTWQVEVGPVLRKLPMSISATFGDVSMIRIFNNV